MMASGSTSGKSSRVDDRLDALQRHGLRGVEAQDAGVGVRAAQYLGDQHAGRRCVGAEARAAGHLVDAVGPEWPRADLLEVARRVAVVFVERHDRTPRIRRPSAPPAR